MTGEAPQRSSEWDVFLAYAEEDRATASLLFAQLRTRVRVFFAPESVRPGDDWDVSVPQAQAVAAVTVILVSPRASRAYYLREEVARALQSAHTLGVHKVVPIFIEGSTPTDRRLPYGLYLKQGIVASNIASLAEVADSIVRVVELARKHSDLAEAPKLAADYQGILVTAPAGESKPLADSVTELTRLLTNELPKMLAMLQLDPAAILIRTSLEASCRGTQIIDQWTHVCADLVKRGVPGHGAILRILDEVQDTLHSPEISQLAARYVRLLMSQIDSSGGGSGGIAVAIVGFCRNEKQRWSEMEQEAEKLTGNRRISVTGVASKLSDAWAETARYLNRYFGGTSGGGRAASMDGGALDAVTR